MHCKHPKVSGQNVQKLFKKVPNGSKLLVLGKHVQKLYKRVPTALSILYQDTRL